MTSVLMMGVTCIVLTAIASICIVLFSPLITIGVIGLLAVVIVKFVVSLTHKSKR